MDNKQIREQFIHLEKKLEERNLRKCIMKELTLREGDEERTSQQSPGTMEQHVMCRSNWFSTADLRH